MEKAINVIDVNTGHVIAKSENKILRSLAIGSCIVIAAFDRNNKSGALAHIMLPGRAPENEKFKTKYAANAIDDLIRKLADKGTKKQDIRVCLIGAGNVLKKTNDTICEKNIESVHELLKEKKIPVVASVLGGSARSSVFMDIDDASISYTEGDSEERLLWQLNNNCD